MAALTLTDDTRATPADSLDQLVLDAAERGDWLILTPEEVQQHAADIERRQSRAWRRDIAATGPEWESAVAAAEAEWANFEARR